jgi:hypothetical protein
MSLYADSKYPVRSGLDAAHAASFANLGQPGTWGTAAQRVAVAAATRKAGIAAGLLEASDGALPASEVTLPKAALDVIEKLAVAPASFEQADYENALAGGLTDAAYVEMVGLVARMCDLDIFARGIGVPLRPLPEPQPGKPSRERPKSAVVEQAWVPTVPNLPAGGEEAKALYDGEQRPYIIRSLSLVPQEFHAHRALEGVQYSPFGKVFDYSYQHHEGLSRPQCEIVAGRISAINECFY